MENADQKTRREKQLSVLVDPEVLTKVKELANQDDRSLSSYINRVLKTHVTENATRKDSSVGVSV